MPDECALLRCYVARARECVECGSSVAPGARGPHRCVAVQEAPPSGKEHGKRADSDAEFPQNRQK